MSTCISTHGEFGSHDPDDTYTCKLCGHLDEDGLIAELERLRADVGRLTAALAEANTLRLAIIEQHQPLIDRAGRLKDELVEARREHNALVLDAADFVAERDTARAQLADAVSIANERARHLVTLKDALDEAEARVALLEPVGDAAKVWRDQFARPADPAAEIFPRRARLIAAVDALEAAETQTKINRMIHRMEVGDQVLAFEEAKIGPTPPPAWPRDYPLNEHVRNPCECNPVDCTTWNDRRLGLRAYMAGRHNPNCPVHWKPPEVPSGQ